MADGSAGGAGRLLSAGIMVLIAGPLNSIWGTAAIHGANFYVDDVDREIRALGVLDPAERARPGGRGFDSDDGQGGSIL